MKFWKDLIFRKTLQITSKTNLEERHPVETDLIKIRLWQTSEAVLILRWFEGVPGLPRKSQKEDQEDQGEVREQGNPH